MDGLKGAGVSVPDTSVSVPFQRVPVLYFVAGSSFSPHSKGFNRTPYGDRSSTAQADAGSAGFGSASLIIADDFGLVSTGISQLYMFRSESGGLAHHGNLKLEPSNLPKKGLLYSSSAGTVVDGNVSDPTIQLSLGPHGGGATVNSRGLTGGFLDQEIRIGDWVNGTDLVGSDLRTHGENLETLATAGSLGLDGLKLTGVPMVSMPTAGPHGLFIKGFESHGFLHSKVLDAAVAGYEIPKMGPYQSYIAVAGSVVPFVVGNPSSDGQNAAMIFGGVAA